MNRILHTDVWAMDRPHFLSIMESIRTSAVNLLAPLSAEQMAELKARTEPQFVESATRRGPKSGTVAVVPIYGPIVYRDSFFTYLFGGVSARALTATINDLAANETVSAIVLDIDSPGGTSAGLTELAEAVRNAREVKHVAAVSNYMMASAAYWIGAQADEIVAPVVSQTGSVGCFLYHESLAGFYEQVGVEPTYIYTPEYKVEGNDTEPLSDEARAEMQRTVETVYNLFVADVAKGRGVTSQKVQDDFGKGRAMMGKDAKAAGLIDRVDTFDATLARLTGKSGQVAGPDAELTPTYEYVSFDRTITTTTTVTVEQEPEPEPDPAPDDDGQEPQAPPDAPLEVQHRTRQWRLASI